MELLFWQQENPTQVLLATGDAFLTQRQLETASIWRKKRQKNQHGTSIGAHSSLSTVPKYFSPSIYEATPHTDGTGEVKSRNAPEEGRAFVAVWDFTLYINIYLRDGNGSNSSGARTRNRHLNH